MHLRQPEGAVSEKTPLSRESKAEVDADDVDNETVNVPRDETQTKVEQHGVEGDDDGDAESSGEKKKRLRRRRQARQ